MPGNWDEKDEHGNTPGPIVGFCQFAFAQRAEDDLRARFGDSAPEDQVVAYLTDQKRIRAVAEAVLIDLSERHPVWVEEQHRLPAPAA